jgi:2,4-dienoyl-CoA reductase-like NADH-dependent reductase (Old Yellow Enzyme family)
MPATDYLENASPPVDAKDQWTLDDALQLAVLLVDHGADFLDITGGGTDARQKITPGPGYQVRFAAAIKDALAKRGGEGARKVYVGTVGEVTAGKQAATILEAGDADAVLVGRAFLKDPDLVWHWADEVGVDIHVASQCEFPLNSPLTFFFYFPFLALVFNCLAVYWGFECFSSPFPLKLPFFDLHFETGLHRAPLR